jgi:hypothetical protein
VDTQRAKLLQDAEYEQKKQGLKTGGSMATGALKAGMAEQSIVANGVAWGGGVSSGQMKALQVGGGAAVGGITANAKATQKWLWEKYSTTQNIIIKRDDSKCDNPES